MRTKKKRTTNRAVRAAAGRATTIEAAFHFPAHRWCTASFPVCSPAPIIGFILGSMAVNKANAEMDRLPGGKRARAARKQLQLAKTLGVIGMCLSFVMLIVGIVLRIVSK